MPFKKGFVTRGGVPIELDSGDYPACLAEALARSAWHSFPERQKAARLQGRYIGIGIANYVEGTGRGPFEQVNVRLESSGLIRVTTGAAAMGQGLKTVLAQIVAEQLGGAIERVVVSAGDSGQITLGFGGFNSRQTVMAGSSAHVAAVKVREKVLKVASHLLEVSEADLDISGDHVGVKGADIKVTMARIAKEMIGSPGFLLPGNLQPGVEATEAVVINAMTYANGCTVVEVEVDPEIGEVKVLDIIFVHDAGKVVNPMMVDGQLMGALAHGIGNSLYEWMGFGPDGQPLTTNLADYLLVTATEMPPMQFSHRESPTPLNPLGVKGVGESGVIPLPAAIASAVEDALSPFGVRIRNIPIKPDALYAQLNQSA
jgi:carbon-monoxide dehydrogenase large subunit